MLVGLLSIFIVLGFCFVTVTHAQPSKSNYVRGTSSVLSEIQHTVQPAASSTQTDSASDVRCMSYLIWHPDFNRKSENYNTMSRHLKFVNFTCDHPEKYNYVKKRAQLPKIKYTENTIMRSSYIHPSRYVELAKLSDTGSRFACSPNNKAVTGIVPNLIVSDYLPVLEK